MKLIQPAEISSKIMTLFADADEYIIIVSPYNDISNWQKLLNYLNKAIARNVKIEYYVRKGADHKGLELLPIIPIPIKNLHSKIYLNEKYAIITSMNLVQYSDENSLDIGVIVDEIEEVDQIHSYINRYIRIEGKPDQPLSQKIIDEPILVDFFSKRSDWKDHDYTVQVKEYYENSKYIKTFGFETANRKFGYFIHFREDGFVEYWEQYEHGKATVIDKIKYDSKISLYDLVFSLTNIISCNYEVSVKDFYFGSYLEDYINKNPDLLYNYIEENLKIELEERNHNTVQNLVEDIRKCLLNCNKTGAS